MTYRWNCAEGHKLYDRYEYLAESLPDGMDDPRADAAWREWRKHKDSCPECSGLKPKGEEK